VSTVDVAGAVLNGVGVVVVAAPPKENPVDEAEVLAAPNNGAGVVLGLEVTVEVPKGDGVVVDALAPNNEPEAPGMLGVVLKVGAELVAAEAPPNKEGVPADAVEVLPNSELGLLAVFPNSGADVVGAACAVPNAEALLAAGVPNIEEKLDP
jgi:hypothetical protein